MRLQETCRAPTQNGEPCRSFAISDRGFCVSHDPDYLARKREGSRRGGEARANARRAARQWAAIGEQLTAADLPAILRACMFSVKAGTLEPSQAQAIAALAKTSVSIASDLELEQRITALEEAASLTRKPTPLRRVS